MKLTEESLLFDRSLGGSYNVGARSFPDVPYSPLGKMSFASSPMSIDRRIFEDFGDSLCRTASGGIENYNDVDQVDKLLG